MPTMPKVLADAMESIFSGMMHPVTVQQVEYLHPQFKQVVFTGESLQDVKYKPGWEIEFRVNQTDYRHYTPSYFDAEKGVCEVLFYLHGKGPGSQWANNLRPGDQIKLMGPGKKIELDSNWARYVFLGDETTVGLFLEMQRGLRLGQQLDGAIETDPQLGNLTSLANLQLNTVPRTDKPGEALMKWIAQQKAPDTSALYYVAGHAQSIQQLRSFLRLQGVSARQIITRPYWSDGKKGL